MLFDKITDEQVEAQLQKLADAKANNAIANATVEPREIKGIQSQGMILMAEDADGRLDFVNPTSAIKPGSTVR